MFPLESIENIFEPLYWKYNLLPDWNTVKFPVDKLPAEPVEFWFNVGILDELNVPEVILPALVVSVVADGARPVILVAGIVPESFDVARVEIQDGFA